MKKRVLITLFLMSVKTLSCQCLNSGSTITGNPYPNWDDCGNDTEMWGTETTYGGTNGSNGVAEIDAFVSLCQSISGLVVGSVYQLSFNYTRRPFCADPSVQVNITLPNGSTSSVTAINTTWAWSSFSITFVATTTSGNIVLNVPSTYSNGCGMIVDNVCLTLFSALPLELLFFDAFKNENKRQVDLIWQTEIEINTDYFIIERSIDLLEWFQIENQTAIGNTSSGANYSTIDLNPIIGTNYYRLRQISNNGEEQISQIRSVNFNDEAEIFYYPNPTTGIIHIKGALTKNAIFRLVDQSGKQIQNLPTKIENDYWVLDFSEYAEGVYYLEVEGENGREILKINYLH